MDLTIRTAGAADAQALHALIQSTYRGDSARAGWTHEADMIAGERIPLAEIEAIIGDPDKVFLVHDGDGGLVACILVADEGDSVGYFGLLAVAPGRQASGIGRRLIAGAEAHAREAFGARTMELTVIDGRDELIAYYERRGYALTGETRPLPVVAEGRLFLRVMAKRLANA